METPGQSIDRASVAIDDAGTSDTTRIAAQAFRRGRAERERARTDEAQRAGNIATTAIRAFDARPLRLTAWAGESNTKRLRPFLAR
jgi:hypothetical protein